MLYFDVAGRLGAVTLKSTMANLVRPVVVSGPSGSGKSTLLTRLFKDYPDCFAFSVSRKYKYSFTAAEDEQ